PIAPDVPAADPLQDVLARQAVADQQAQQLIDEAVRRASRMVRTDPNGAHDFLKRTLDGVRNNPDVSERVRTSLAQRLETTLHDTDRRGAVVLRDQAQAAALAARAAERLGVEAAERAFETNFRERLRVFHQLMNEAREDEAFKLAQEVRADLRRHGREVPAPGTAAYLQGLYAFHLHTERELLRVREERWLATMLEVERSHIPFPDEPPVVFPAPAVWKRIYEQRKDRYDVSSLGPDAPKRTLE